MNPSQIRFLIFISFAILSMAGCSINHPNLFVVEKRNSSLPLNLPFSQPGTEAVYTSKIELYDQYFSGLLAFHVDSGNRYDIVFLNELGMKFFDFTMDRNGLRINDCIQSLDRKGVIKIFEEVFETLFLVTPDLTFENIMFDMEKEHTVYPVDLNGMGYYYVSNSSGKLEKIEKYKRSNKVLSILFKNSEEMPDEMDIVFHRERIIFNLKIIENGYGPDFQR